MECEWCHKVATVQVNCKTATKPFSVRLCDKCVDESGEIGLFNEDDEYVALFKRSIINGKRK